MITKNRKPDLNVLNSSINHCVRNRDMIAAGYYFKLIYKLNLVPNLKTFTALMNGYLKIKDLRNVEKVYKTIISLAIQPDAFIFTTLFNAFKKDGSKLDHYFVEMERFKIIPTIPLMNSLLRGYGSQSDFKKLDYLLDYMKSYQLAPNLITYSSLIQVYGQHQNIKKMECCFKEMISKLIKPDLIIFNTMLEAYSNVVQTDQMLLMYHTLKDYNVKPDVITITILLNHFISVNDMKQIVFILDQSLSMGLRLDVTLFNSVIKAFTRQIIFQSNSVLHDTRNGTLTAFQNSKFLNFNETNTDDLTNTNLFLSNKVQSLYSNLFRNNFHPNASTFSNLMKFFGTIQDWNTMEIYLKKMLHLKVKGVEGYTSAMKGFGISGQLEKMEIVYLDMCKNKIQPDSKVFDTLISEFTRWNIQDKVLIYQQLKKEWMVNSIDTCVGI
ncbi:hypothetical protein BC833DRAFT_604208 [Globomyces pollinis-pini]|nr:hypothetical protein BC833DRAFT_604208 [Globomyces pollinis-pini]